MEVTFYIDEDAIWFEFADVAYGYESNPGDGVNLHFSDDTLIRAIFVDYSKGIHVKHLPESERKQVVEFANKHNVGIIEM